MSAALGQLTWPQAGRGAREGLLVVPVGSTEQHGPHLPLSTDTDIAVGLADRFAAAWPGAVVAPPLAYGSSGEHAGFPGTVSIGQEAVELVLVELGRSACETYERVVLVSAHGGNAAAVARATKRLVNERRRVLAWSPSWRGDAHAGQLETSVMLALRPELVTLDLAEPGNTEPIGALMGRLQAEGVRPLAPNGVLGDPAGASAESGRALLDEAGADLVATVRGWVGA